MSIIKKEDRVRVLSGKNAGREGRVLRVLKEKESALVERINMVKRHTKPGGKGVQQGGIIEKEAPIRLCKLMLICPKCSRPTRVGVRVVEGKHSRFCKKCLEQLEN
ncbi:MAG: 50S ribosomal protein L24 [Deltaproteobacteria bacterium]|nr:50S ribosomal protein L24 [Deltaproteobacteria bacterium]